MPEKVICDFCSGPSVVWSYPARSFPYGLGMSQGGWAACERCHQLIKVGDRRGLVVRSLITLISSSPDMEPDQAELRETIAELHQKFFENRIGEAVPYVEEEVLVNTGGLT